MVGLDPRGLPLAGESHFASYKRKKTPPDLFALNVTCSSERGLALTFPKVTDAQGSLPYRSCDHDHAGPKGARTRGAIRALESVYARPAPSLRATARFGPWACSVRKRNARTARSRCDRAWWRLSAQGKYRIHPRQLQNFGDRPRDPGKLKVACRLEHLQHGDKRAKPA